MPRIAQKKAIRGSQKWLQELVYQHLDFLDDTIQLRLQLSANDTITWLSPLEEDYYAEYQDKVFLERVSICLENRGLASFWPRGGPVWDGLGKSSHGDIILVEAKSHISELASSCKAGPQSLKLIEKSLVETATFYGAASTAGWLQGYYQYANRLAHFYLLRHLNGIQAWLVFLYFVNDIEMAGPKSVQEWQEAIDAVHAHLSITEEQLRPYVIDVFFDVETKDILER